MITPTYFTLIYFYHPYRTSRCQLLLLFSLTGAKLIATSFFHFPLLFILITSIRSPILYAIQCFVNFFLFCIIVYIQKYTHPSTELYYATTTTTIKMKLLVLSDDGERKGNLIVLIMHRTFFSSYCIVYFPSLSLLCEVT